MPKVKDKGNEIKVKRKKKEDQRSILTKRLIKESFAKLLKDYPSDNISVSKLCEKAEINRGTFYLYYKDIYDLRYRMANDYLEDVKASIFTLLNKKNTTSTLADHEMILELLNYLYENKLFTSALLGNNFDKRLIDEISNIGKSIVLLIYPNVFKNKEPEEYDNYYLYVSSGSIALIIRWVRNNYKESIESLATTLERLISSTMTYFK